MVHPKAGSYGAVAQNARKRQKEATSNGKISQVKKALPPTPAGKKINGRTRSQERAQTAEENRKNNERILLQKKLEQNGGNIDNMELGDFEKMLDLMETDEKSGEQVSEKEEEPDKKSEKTKLKLAQKLIQKFKVDREDYMLQYADAQERPIFFEEYQSKCYPCLYTAELQELKVDVAGVSEKLLEYANALVSGYVPPTPHQLPGVLLHCESFRTTSQNVNICISPLQILRGWSLLINIARNKTLDELSNFICKHSSDILKTKEDFNAQLLALHIEAEDFFDGCVRLFTELPHHLRHNDDIRRGVNLFYGGKSKRAAIQHHCFATDSDGLYSCHRINEEVSISTRGSIRYVVPENAAPNWRSSMCLVSAMACIFYWKTVQRPTETSNFKFVGENGDFSMCTGISAIADVRKKGDMVRLESLQEGVYLFIIPEKEDKPQAKKTIDKSILNDIYSSEKWEELKNKNMLIPKATTSHPISLYNHSKHSGLRRIYSSEKSELRELKSTEFDEGQSPQFITLFDHYHKTSFEIRAENPPSDEKRKFDEFSPEKAHQSVDDSLAKHFGKFQVKDDGVEDFMFTYFENHLDKNKQQFLTIQDGYQFAPTASEQLVVMKPFFYIMTRQVNSQPFIVCSGYFNNNIWANGE